MLLYNCLVTNVLFVSCFGQKHLLNAPKLNINACKALKFVFKCVFYKINSFVCFEIRFHACIIVL